MNLDVALLGHTTDVVNCPGKRRLVALSHISRKEAVVHCENVITWNRWRSRTFKIS